jgi:hypothetical protein
MSHAIATARAMISDRLQRHPASPFYEFAARDMARIDARLAHGPPIDRAFYQTLAHGIGLMCARELEASDMPFCDAIYALLTEINRTTK